MLNRTYAVAADAVHVLLNTRREVAKTTLRAVVTVATVPAAADPLADFPPRHTGAKRYDLAYDLVAGNSRKLLAEQPVLGDVVTTRCEHINAY
jgi:hypothetical protein